VAPDSTYLADFLATQTRLTLTGVSHNLAPFCFIAAFPSLHVSAAVILLLSMRRSLPMTLFNGFGVVFTLLATVILGWHYFVDGLLGLGLGWACWAFAVFVTNRDTKVRAFAPP